MEALTITVYGMPAPQGSKRFVGMSKAGRGIMIESSSKVKPWRQAVTQAAMEACSAIQSQADHGPGCVSGPIAVEMVFTLPKPKSAPKSRVTFPDRKPDLSKLVRSTEDALTDAGTWEDDARVISCTARKVFPREGDGALHVPGAVILIRRANG